MAITDDATILQLQLLLLVFPAGSQALVGAGWQAKRQQWQMMMMVVIMVIMVMLVIVMVMVLIVMMMVMMQMTPAAVASNQPAVAVAAHRLHLSEPKYRRQASSTIPATCGEVVADLETFFLEKVETKLCFVRMVNVARDQIALGGSIVLWAATHQMTNCSTVLPPKIDESFHHMYGAQKIVAVVQS